jgi:hypothetical protein
MTGLVENAFPAEALKSGFWSDTPELAGGYCLWMSTDRADFMTNRYGRYFYCKEANVALIGMLRN